MLFHFKIEKFKKTVLTFVLVVGLGRYNRIICTRSYDIYRIRTRIEEPLTLNTLFRLVAVILFHLPRQCTHETIFIIIRLFWRLFLFVFHIMRYYFFYQVFYRCFYRWMFTNSSTNVQQQKKRQL